jgi:hypothetical protein
MGEDGAGEAEALGGGLSVTFDDEERRKQREMLAREEAAEKVAKASGAVAPMLTEKDRKLLDRVIKLGVIARMAAKTKVMVKAFDEEGVPVATEERLGNEDLILAALLNQLVGTSEEASR